MVADCTRRHVLEVIRDIGRLEAMLDEPNEVLKAALREVISNQRPVSIPLPRRLVA
jgi:hypothetical protein